MIFILPLLSETFFNIIANITFNNMCTYFLFYVSIEPNTWDWGHAWHTIIILYIIWVYILASQGDSSTCSGHEGVINVYSFSRVGPVSSSPLLWIHSPNPPSSRGVPAAPLRRPRPEAAAGAFHERLPTVSVWSHRCGAPIPVWLKTLPQAPITGMTHFVLNKSLSHNVSIVKILCFGIRKTTVAGDGLSISFSFCSNIL